MKAVQSSLGLSRERMSSVCDPFKQEDDTESSADVVDIQLFGADGALGCPLCGSDIRLKRCRLVCTHCGAHVVLSYSHHCGKLKAEHMGDPFNA